LYGSKVPIGRRLHGEQRDDLEEAILNYVAQTSGGFVKRPAAPDSDRVTWTPYSRPFSPDRSFQAACRAPPTGTLLPTTSMRLPKETRPIAANISTASIEPVRSSTVKQARSRQVPPHWSGLRIVMEDPFWSPRRARSVGAGS
jgi:hypothetical protein